MGKVSKLKIIPGTILGFLLVFSLVIPVATPVAAADYPLGTGDGRIEAALDFLEDSQNSDGSIGSNLEQCCYAVAAIDAAGRDPHDYTAGGDSLVDYIQNKASSHVLPATPSKALCYEYYLFAIAAARENPWDFGGVNFIDGLKSLFDGEQIGQPGIINDDFWGIIALIGIGESHGSEIVQASKSYILANQNSDGGWGCTPAGASDVCDTANAIMALIAAGQSPSSQAIQSGLDYIESEQNDDGGFPYTPGAQSDVASDARVIAAIKACGENPTSARWTKNGHDPVEHALSLQRDDGGFDWKEGSSSNSEWITSYILPALVGKYWPTRIIYDKTPPSITSPKPSSGTTVNTGTPAISASYSDSLSGVDFSSVLLKVESIDVTSETTITETGVSYTPTTAMEDGTRSAQLTVYDRAGNKGYKAWSFIVDTDASESDSSLPSISGLQPASGASVNTGTPTISASYSGSDSGIDVSSIVLKLDGTDVTSDATVTKTEVSYTPAVPLDNGEHDVELNVSDTAGNQRQREWSFRVEAQLAEEVSLIGKIDASGRILEAVALASADNKVDLKLPGGTTVLTTSGTPPEQITVKQASESPSVSTDVYLIGHTYELGPDGTSFNPPITLTLHYEEITLTDGIAWDVNGDGSINILDIALVAQLGGKTLTEESFKIACFDTNHNEWVIQEDSVIDTAGNTVTTRISHFSRFTILGGVIETYSTPAAFVVKALEVTPETAGPGENVTIKALVANTGEVEGSYSLSLKIGGVTEMVKELMLAPGEEQLVTFAASRENAGSYEVEAGGKTVEFTIEEAPSSEKSPTSDSPGSIDWAFWAFVGSIIAGILAIIAITIFIRGRRHGGV